MSVQAQRFRRVCVVTGDHHLPDVTKPHSRYGDQDRRYHATMRGALLSLPDYTFEFLTDHSRLIPRMLQDPPEFVLNFCDTGFRNVPDHELHLPALLEMLDIPYSGAPPAGMVLCYDKSLVRMAAAALGIPTPTEVYVGPDQALEVIDDFGYPGLIKPNAADGSLGITREAVVEDARQARSYLETLRRQLPGRAALVQEFLPGPEYGLALIGNPETGFAVLPPLAVDYSGLPDGLAPILGYESKTDPGSPYWTQIHIRAAELAPKVVQHLGNAAQRLFVRLQCRDYARFDFRTGADGTIKLMEVNPNPAWDCEAKLALMAGFAGKSYAEMLGMVLEAAQARLGAPPAAG
jgi:D-alanine-D-alanine ligase